MDTRGRPFRALALAGVCLFLFSGLGVGPAFDCEPGGAADVSATPVVTAVSFLLGDASPLLGDGRVDAPADDPDEAEHPSDECCCRAPRGPDARLLAIGSSTLDLTGLESGPELPDFWREAAAVPVPGDPFLLPFALPPPTPLG